MTIKPLLGNGRLRENGASATSVLTASWLDAGVVFDCRHWVCDETEMTWTAPSHLIVLTQQGRTARTRVSHSGAVIHDGPDRPGSLSFVPAGAERSGVYQDADLVYSALWIDPSLACLDEFGSIRLPILINAGDAIISALLSSLQYEIASGAIPNAAYVEHLVALAMHRIAAIDGSRPQTRRHGKLGKTTMQRLEEHIEARLDCEIGLAELAAVAGMRSDSFARRFKASTGLAPYAYVLERRMRRAEQLLAKPDMTLGAIAAALGFSSQSHFTTTFKRLRGTTPQVFRRKVFPESCNDIPFSERPQA